MKNTDLIAVAEPEFKVGDLLVATNGHCNEIFEVERKGSNGGFYDTRWRKLNVKCFRHATPAEIKAGHRLNPSNTGELETLEMIDISPNTVVINESN